MARRLQISIRITVQFQDDRANSATDGSHKRPASDLLLTLNVPGELGEEHNHFKMATDLVE